jgi:hypothetical protein
MGEVDRARDSRLGRDVDLNVLARQRRRRRTACADSKQEARGAATLNHPNTSRSIRLRNPAACPS